MLETFAESGAQSTTRTYDAFDRLETVTDRWDNVLRYAYDANGNRTQLTDPSRQVTSYSFDALNRLSTVTSAAGVTEYSYFRDSRIRKITYPNGTTASYVHDDAGRVQSIDNRHNGALVSRFIYEYDLNGNRVEQIEEHSGQPEETTSYTLDLADRLLEVAYPDKTTTYTYDDAGNRKTEQERDLNGLLITEKTFTYNVRNQLEEMANLLDATRSVAYGYDANGNRISRVQGGEVTDFAFDVLDRITQVTKEATILGTYRYDAQNLRIEKTTDEGTARYVYDGQSVLTRTDADGTTKFDYGPDRLLSVSDPTEGRAFYLFDGLGSITNLTTPAGTLLARYKYDAWGNYRDLEGTAANPFGFTGHEHDSETGLIYARARFYDPEVGLFLSEDPASGELTNPPSLHRYLYAFQNPTAFVDPTGAFPSGRDFLAFGKGFLKGAATAAVIVGGGALVAAFSPVIATVGAVALVGTFATNAVINRYEQAAETDIQRLAELAVNEEFVPEASISDAFQLGISDSIGLTAVAEALDGTEVGTGRRLSSEERAERLGTVAGATAGGLGAAKGVGVVKSIGDDVGRAVGQGIQRGARELVPGAPKTPPRPPTGVVAESNQGTGGIVVRAPRAGGAQAATAPKPPRLLGPAGDPGGRTILGGKVRGSRLKGSDIGPRELRRDQLGDFLGEGGNKQVFAFGEDKAVGLLKLGKSAALLDEERALLNQLEEVGIPTVNARPVSIDRQSGLLFDRFPQGSKDVVRLSRGKVRTVGSSLNKRSVADLQAIRHTLVSKKVRVNDLQFLIGRDGRIVVADPLGVAVGPGPSKNNLRMIDLLIRASEEK